MAANAQLVPPCGDFDAALATVTAMARRAGFEPATPGLGTRQSKERAKWAGADRRLGATETSGRLPFTGLTPKLYVQRVTGPREATQIVFASGRGSTDANSEAGSAAG